MTGLDAVCVVVPARDEEQLLPGCLAAMDLAREVLEQARPDLSVTVLVVLDSCVDRSADVVRRHPRVDALTVSVGGVGAARAAGADAVLPSGAARERTWLASTDADSRVPPGWLLDLVTLAEGGVDLVLGTVEPQDVDGHLLTRWRQRHRLRDGHPHVHGANLGVRASRYAEVGGFRGVSLHEDVLLADAVKATGAPWVATDATRVRTAGRLDGRVSGGFATYLHELAGEAARETLQDLAHEPEHERGHAPAATARPPAVCS